MYCNNNKKCYLQFKEAIHTAAHSSLAVTVLSDSQLFIFTAEALTSKPHFRVYPTPWRDRFHRYFKCKGRVCDPLVWHIPRNLPFLINYQKGGQIEYVGLCQDKSISISLSVTVKTCRWLWGYLRNHCSISRGHILTWIWLSEPLLCHLPCNSVRYKRNLVLNDSGTMKRHTAGAPWGKLFSSQ